MSAPTPAEVFGPGGRPLPFFTRSTLVGSRRIEARDEAIAAAERLARTIVRLRSRDEADLDLHVEADRRDADRLSGRIVSFELALTDPAGPPPPAPAHLVAGP